MSILYDREQGLDAEEFREVLVASGMGPMRPIDDKARLKTMLASAGIIVTARRGGTLVGVARGVTDFAWSCYMSEVAVSKEAQRLGVGKGLLDEARRHLGPSVMLLLASVPESVGFYEKIGMTPLPNGFYFKRTE